MEDYSEFCDCYLTNHHSDNYVPFLCSDCEKMDRLFWELTQEEEPLQEIGVKKAANY